MTTTSTHRDSERSAGLSRTVGLDRESILAEALRLVEQCVRDGNTATALAVIERAWEACGLLTVKESRP
jgi:hypothetical protein